MAAIQGVDIPEHEENDPCSEAEKKIEPSQALEIKEAAGQEEKSTTVQVRKSELWPTPPTKRSDEDRRQKLEDIAVSQQEEMEKLRRKVEEAQVAMDREREAAKELHIQVLKQKQTINSRQIEVRHLRSEQTKKHKEEKETALSQLSKSEEENNELKATISSLNKEVFKISRTIKVVRGETESQTRELGEAQNEIAALHNEVAQLQNTVTNLENKVISLNCEKTNLEDVNVKQQCDIDLRERIIKQVTSEMYSMAAGYEEQKVALLNQINDYKVSMDDCKLSLKSAETMLQMTEGKNMLISKHLKDYKASSKRTSKIMRAEKETKVEMKEKIETLEKENEKLRSELNNGFIGSYRQMKRLFLRVADTLLFRTIY